MFGCKGKRVYKSTHHAKLAHSKAGFRVRPYYCDACEGYHVANSDKKDQQTPPRTRAERPIERPPVTDKTRAATLFESKGIKYEMA